MALKITLEKISKSISQSQDDREFLLRNTREIIILCSKSIISIHNNDARSAKANLRRAGTLLEKYRKKTSMDLRRYMITAEQEYVEATCLLLISEKKDIPSDEDLQVMPESYVLGLLDCVGELKRMVFDKIRTNDIGEASRIFDLMENLYMHLYPFSMYDKVLKDARRKTDVDRILVDSARGAVTEEKRRIELIRALDENKTEMRAMGFEPTNS